MVSTTIPNALIAASGLSPVRVAAGAAWMNWKAAPKAGTSDSAPRVIPTAGLFLDLTR
jgi:hypothetical protein